MAWETALDRLFLHQIHAAEKGEAKHDDVLRQLTELQRLAPERPGTAFLLGYAHVLTGIETPAPSGATASRWHLFGRLRAHDRRGERSWVADLVADPAAVLDLLREPRIAQQCLPLLLRTLFWSGDLHSAVQTIGFLAAQEDASAEHRTMVDASLTDLLARIEHEQPGSDRCATVAILDRVLELPCFERLPADVRARFRCELGRHHLSTSEFAPALEQLHAAKVLATTNGRTRGRILALGMLAELRLHTVDLLEPRKDRPERDAAIAWMGGVDLAEADTMPEAAFCRGILAYETGDHAAAKLAFDAALRGARRQDSRDDKLAARSGFFLAAALLAGGDTAEAARALHLMDAALDHVRPDLESFYPVHEALKVLDRRVALKFLDAVDVRRGSSPDQLLFVALEYLSLAEAEPAAKAAERVLGIAVDLDQRIEALRALLSAHNMLGDRDAARVDYDTIRDLLLQRGKFQELEVLLKNEAFVGQALDHLEIKCELVALYEEMEDRDYEKATLQTAIARALRARKDVQQLQEAVALLREVAVRFPELAKDELATLEKLLAVDAPAADPSAEREVVAAAARRLGHAPRVLVVGGNERQRRHHPRFDELAAEWEIEGEWLMANYTSPQKVVGAVADRMRTGLDLLVLLHWNRHETTEPALELARKGGVAARTVHYAGFTSLQVALVDMLGKLGTKPATAGREKAGTRG
jgi:tetratricopeptide (TPR) repeat protein